MGKRKADCTPEEWKKILEYKRNWRATHKHKTKKDDYTEEEWNHILEYNRKRYRERKDVREKARERKRKWRAEHPELCREYSKKYREKNRDAINKRHRENYIKDNNLRKKNREQCKRYHEKHKQIISDRKKAYRNKYIDEYKKQRKKSEQSNKVLYSLWYDRLTIDEEPIKDNNGYLLVRDYHTKEYFYPTRLQLMWRVRCLEGKSRGEMHLYKDEKSKKNCPVYNQTKFPKGIRKTRKNQSEIEPFWRKRIISRANGRCERCGKESDKLIAHHLAPRAICVFDGDIDNGMALCPECHKEVHDTDGCRFHELAAEKRKTA